MNNIRTKRLVETALLLAISVILSFIHLPSLPYGGEITLCSTLPIILIAYRHGVKWGIFSGFIYSILSLLIDPSAFRAGYTWVILVGTLVFDYFFASCVLGLGGIFRKRISKPSISLLCGSLLALFLKYLAHVLSGYLFFWQFAEEMLASDGFLFGEAILSNTSGKMLYLLYSIVYNALHMVPEMIITAIVAVVIGSIPVIVKQPTSVTMNGGIHHEN